MNNKKRSIAVLTMLIGTLSIGGIMAYFTDADTATNTFTVGKVSLDLQEPGWEPPTEIVPKQEFKKDPQIKNDGLNDEFVFIKVTTPYANIETANEDGTKNEAMDTELFAYAINDGWTELSSERIKDTTNLTISRVYAYTGDYTDAMKVLGVNETTPALFNHVRFANIVEDQNIEGNTLNMIVNAYGIQATNLNDGKDVFDGNNSDGVITPQEVWNILKNQNPSVDYTVNEEVNTDIKQ